jgi:AcrR family transcriptional regulator
LLVRANTRTFTETARRAQIVEAAIATLADLGHGRTSFARIAERAGLSSTGLISYHFAGRTELMDAVGATLHARVGGFLRRRLAGADTPSAQLAAYVEGWVAFAGAHRTEMAALVAVRRDQADAPPLAEILKAGQESGEFRPFDTGVVATTVRRAVDGLPEALAARPDLDLDRYARELSTLFTKAVAA